MAKQQLYTMVPAKLSIFNKELSYDTFAISDGLTEMYIKENLLKLCDYKPSIDEKTYILDDKMPYIYMSYFSKKTGELIQSCISFLAQDFTGERHGHFVHSLILSSDECENILTSYDAALFSAENFLHDIDKLDISLDSNKPYLNYPELDYKIENICDYDQLINKYDENMLKQLIYAVLISTTKGNKTINIDIGSTLKKYSEEALFFINTFFSIFPFHIKNKLTYVSYTSDVKKSPMSLFKIRFVYGLDKQIAYAKSSYNFDFTHKIVYGLKTDDASYKKSENDVDFLYSLFLNTKKRKKFLTFMCRLVPTLNEYKFERLGYIILLYCKIQGIYDDEVLIPDDESILVLLNAYEHYRTRLTTDERCCILKTLERYSNKKIAIPQPVFTKIKKIYDDEHYECKSVIMNTVLALIHTDAMRDKLFMFIKQVYSNETPTSRINICENLTRVFYGKFLQVQILNFFSENFESESMQTKAIILEKVLASIRSEQIQDQIISFLNKHYMSLDSKLRNKMRSELYKELSEADKLSAKIIDLFEKHFIEEDRRVQGRQIRSVYLRIEKAENTGNHKLADIIFEDLYNLKPMSKELLRIILIEVKNVSLFNYLMKKMLSGKKLQGVFDAFSIIYENYKKLPSETEESLKKNIIILVNKNINKSNLFDYVELDVLMRDKLKSLNSCQAELLYQDIYNNYICNIIKQKLCDSFDIQLCADCLNKIYNYIVKTQDYISTKEYKSIIALKKLCDSMQMHNVEDTVKYFVNLNIPHNMKKKAVDLLSYYLEKATEENSEIYDEANEKVYLEYFISYAIPTLINLTSNETENTRNYEHQNKDFGTVYKRCLEKIRFFYTKKKKMEYEKKNKSIPENNIKINSLLPIDRTFNAAVEFCKLVKKYDELKIISTSLYSNDKNPAYIDALFSCLVSDLMPKKSKVLKKYIEMLSEEFPELYIKLNNNIDEYKLNNPMFIKAMVNKLFLKKSNSVKQKVNDRSSANAAPEPIGDIMQAQTPQMPLNNEDPSIASIQDCENFIDSEDSEVSGSDDKSKVKSIAEFPNYVDDETDLEDWETIINIEKSLSNVAKESSESSEG